MARLAWLAWLGGVKDAKDANSAKNGGRATLALLPVGSGFGGAVFACPGRPCAGRTGAETLCPGAGPTAVLGAGGRWRRGSARGRYGMDGLTEIEAERARAR